MNPCSILSKFDFMEIRNAGIPQLRFVANLACINLLMMKIIILFHNVYNFHCRIHVFEFEPLHDKTNNLHR